MESYAINTYTANGQLIDRELFGSKKEARDSLQSQMKLWRAKTDNGIARKYRTNYTATNDKRYGGVAFKQDGRVVRFATILTNKTA